MLDLRFINDNLDDVRRNTELRRVTVDFDRFRKLFAERLEAIQRSEESQRRQNEIARSMKGKMPDDERRKLVEEGRALKADAGSLKETLRDIETELGNVARQIPNLTHPDVPTGASEEENREIRRWGDIPSFPFRPRNHVEIAETLDIADFEGGARVAGQKFYYLKNEGALLELALAVYAMRRLVAEGFTPYVTPDVARDEILTGIGFNPRGEETQIYSVAGTDLCLVATAEITLGGLLADTILEADALPVLMAGFSHCFRTEAGAHGRAGQGLYRVHQFSKVEMFAFTAPDASEAMHERFVQLEESLFQGLGVPYRVVDVCTGDLGGPAYRKYDLEAWMPGRGKGGAWGEITSTSNCTDYQARRLNVRYRPGQGAKPEFAHMLNGTAIAVSRALIAILENLQQEDGGVRVPEALRDIVGVDVIRPRS